MGFCAVPGTARRSGIGPGAGGPAYGWGGRGWRHVFQATGVPGWARGRGCPRFGAGPQGWAAGEDELDNLENYASSLEDELRTVKERLEGLRRQGSRPVEE